MTNPDWRQLCRQSFDELRTLPERDQRFILAVAAMMLSIPSLRLTAQEFDLSEKVFENWATRIEGLIKGDISPTDKELQYAHMFYYLYSRLE